VSFFNSGIPLDSTYYTDGHITTRHSYYESRLLHMVDSMDARGNGSSAGFREDGRMEHTGQFAAWEKSGPWSYYTMAGVLCSVETMKTDTIFSAMDYDANGQNPTPHKGAYEIESDYPGGAAAWMKYLNKRMGSAKLPKAYTDGKVSGTVIVQFIIDEKGMPTNIEVIQSVYSELDELVCDAIRNSKVWSAAWQHNRPVKSYKKQPIKFGLAPR
jgi:TonB family protein